MPYLLRRIALALPVLAGVATLVFLLVHLIPGDPVEAMLGESASPRDVADLRGRLGLDRPLGEQYIRFAAGAVHGELGTSLRSGQPVARELLTRFAATLELAIAALGLAVAIALPLGALAAARAGTAIDRFARIGNLIGISMPPFWLGPLLAIVGAIWLGWFPVSGHGTWAHLVLPSLTLATPLAAVLAQTTRASVADELTKPYVLAARARGFSVARIVGHAFRNGLIPVTTVFGLQLGGVLTGAVITETVFAWPGIGRYLVQAIAARDYPAVQGTILFIAVVYVGVNLLVDLAYAWLDPRVRYD